MSNDTRLGMNDLIPRLRNNGIVEKLELWSPFNWALSKILSDLLSSQSEPLGLPDAMISEDQLLQCIADLKGAGLIPNVEVWGEELPAAIIRPAAPTGLGVSAENVWFSPPEPCVGTWRFYVNGVLAATLTDYYITSRASLGCVAGDIVQICQVENGICGWWAKIVVT